MSAIDPTLLAEGSAVPDEDALLAADPSGAWAALVQLRTDAIEHAPPLAPVPNLEAVARWSAETPEVGDEAVLFYAEHSLLMAELLEGSLDALGPANIRQLAAAPGRGPSRDPWPARYSGGGWRVVLGIDESGWLYFSIDAAPDGAPSDGLLVVDDLDLRIPTELRPGTTAGIDDAEELFGGHDLNPIRTLDIEGSTLQRAQE